METRQGVPSALKPEALVRFDETIRKINEQEAHPKTGNKLALTHIPIYEYNISELIQWLISEKIKIKNPAREARGCRWHGS